MAGVTTERAAVGEDPDAFIAELWGYAHALEMKEHPWFKGMRDHVWTREQIVRAEMQHYLRVRMNPVFFGYIVTNVVAEKDYELMPVVMENFMEELGGERTHVDVMLQFLEEAGLTRQEADTAEPAPGTAAAIEMIVGCCQRRSALEGIAMLSFVEAMHGGPEGAAAGMFEAMTKHYGFSARAAATYELHAEQDTGHGERQIEAIRRFVCDAAKQAKVRAAVKLGLEAFNFEWDGHVQAMTGERTYWRGLAPRIDLATPEFRPPG